MQTLIFGLIGSGPLITSDPCNCSSLRYVDTNRLERFCDGRVFFGCGSVGPAEGCLHQISESPSTIVTADAYLANSGELCRYLSTSSALAPSEIIRRLYEKDGEAGLNRLEGDYSFVLFDRTSEEVVCRRDRFGARPLFFSIKDDGAFAFSTVPDHLVEMGAVDGDVDLDAAIHQLQSFTTKDGRTMVRGLRRLYAASQLTVKSGKPSFRRYWRPGQVQCDVPGTFDTWCAGLKQRFEKAVARRLPDRGVVAAQLSSGLDSTGVAMTAARLLKGDDQFIVAFTKQASDAARAKFDGMLDETEIARQVAASSNRVAWEPLPSEIATAFAERESTPILSSPLANDFDETTAIRAAEVGAEVVLTGWGGDNVITYQGFGAAASLLRQRKWGDLWRIERDARQRGGRPWGAIARAAATAYLPNKWRETLFHWRNGKPSYTRYHRDIAGLSAKRWRQHKYCDPRVGDTKQDRIQRLLEPGLAFRLEIMALIGLKHGVRFVHPMFDRELIEYALNCPPEFEYREGRYRAPFREIMHGVVPDICRESTQPKLPLVEIPWHVAREKAGLIRELDRLESDKRLHDYFDFNYVRKRLTEYPDERAAEAHVTKIATTQKVEFSPSMLNASYDAIGKMASMQKLLDKAANGGWRVN